MLKAVDISAGGVFMAGNGQSTGRLGGAVLTAAVGNAASLIIRETDGSGRKLTALNAAAGETASFQPLRDVAYQGNIHVTVTGSGAQAFAYEG